MPGEGEEAPTAQTFMHPLALTVLVVSAIKDRNGQECGANYLWKKTKNKILLFFRENVLAQSDA